MHPAHPGREIILGGSSGCSRQLGSATGAFAGVAVTVALVPLQPRIVVLHVGPWLPQKMKTQAGYEPFALVSAAQRCRRALFTLHSHPFNAKTKRKLE